MSPCTNLPTDSEKRPQSPLGEIPPVFSSSTHPYGHQSNMYGPPSQPLTHSYRQPRPQIYIPRSRPRSHPHRQPRSHIYGSRPRPPTYPYSPPRPQVHGCRHPSPTHSHKRHRHTETADPVRPVRGPSSSDSVRTKLYTSPYCAVAPSGPPKIGASSCVPTPSAYSGQQSVACVVDQLRAHPLAFPQSRIIESSAQECEQHTGSDNPVVTASGNGRHTCIWHFRPQPNVAVRAIEVYPAVSGIQPQTNVSSPADEVYPTIHDIQPLPNLALPSENLYPAVSGVQARPDAPWLVAEPYPAAPSTQPHPHIASAADNVHHAVPDIQILGDIFSPAVKPHPGLSHSQPPTTVGSAANVPSPTESQVQAQPDVSPPTQDPDPGVSHIHQQDNLRSDEEIAADVFKSFSGSAGSEAWAPDLLVKVLKRKVDDLIFSKQELLPVSEMEFEVLFSRKHKRFNLEAYIGLLVQRLNCSNAVFVIMFTYLDRVIEKCNSVELSDWNCHRLLFTCLVLAMKYLEDEVPLNSYFAWVGGVRTEEMNDLEIKLQGLLEWNATVSPETYAKYEAGLIEIATQIAGHGDRFIPSSV